MSDSGSRLSRWSQMKSEARQQTRVRFSVPEEETVAPAMVADAAEPSADRLGEGPESDKGVTTPPGEYATEVEAETGAESGANQELNSAPDLPDIEDLDGASDYSAFMSDKVSDTVRNMALRKLWRTDSVFANLDGLIDYGEDFTDAATVMEGMKSVYTVGRGMVDYEAEEAAKLAAQEEESAAAEAHLRDDGEKASVDVAEDGTVDSAAESEVGQPDTIEDGGRETFNPNLSDQKRDITISGKKEIDEIDGGLSEPVKWETSG